MEETTVERILFHQLEQLRELSQKEAIKYEPEQVIQISLAMAEIGKTYLELYG